MYYILTNRELTILPNILFEGTENAFLVASGNGPELDSAESRRAINKEVAHLFIEAVTELIGRLEHTPQPGRSCFELRDRRQSSHVGRLRARGLLTMSEMTEQLGADGAHISTDSPAVDQLACFSSHLRVILQEPPAG